ncbi:MAG: CcmD family protein [Bacteroidia bacterium]|nr:CcmD family protein [Bacteroidia bacterium]
MTVIADKIEMATGLRKDGMIWVVVTVSMVVFAVLIGYLVLLDRKVRKIEKAA